jgi:protein TonB
MAVVLPLWNTNALPRAVGVFTTIGPPPANRPPGSEHPVAPTAAHRASVATANDFTQPGNIPHTIDMKPDAPRAEEEDPGPPCTVCVVGSTGIYNARDENVLRTMIPVVTAAPAPKPPSRLVVSPGVSQGFLVHQVQPVYPAIARAARMQGTVVLVAVINREGTIQGLHAVSGPPMLVNAAMDAVRQWRYRPYMLGTQPVEVETQISVIFTLSH